MDRYSEGDILEPEMLETREIHDYAVSKDISLFSERGRNEWLRVITFLCVCVFLVVFATVVVAAIVVLAIHYLTALEWLNPDQLTAIRTFLFSGAVTAAVGWMGSYVRRRL